mmetsp:Transcript_5743/g.19224  ORF Transcript_5743/g.19224 Transcript_5743/m.19224 type:complete len:284 (-) Transcript_5743:910-1761(-)
MAGFSTATVCTRWRGASAGEPLLSVPSLLSHTSARCTWLPCTLYCFGLFVLAPRREQSHRDVSLYLSFRHRRQAAPQAGRVSGAPIRLVHRTLIQDLLDKPLRAQLLLLRREGLFGGGGGGLGSLALELGRAPSAVAHSGLYRRGGRLRCRDRAVDGRQPPGVAAACDGSGRRGSRGVGACAWPCKGLCKGARLFRRRRCFRAAERRAERLGGRCSGTSGGGGGGGGGWGGGWRHAGRGGGGGRALAVGIDSDGALVALDGRIGPRRRELARRAKARARGGHA